MGDTRTGIAAACWVGDALLPTLRVMADDERFRVVAVGGTSADVSDLAKSLGVPHHDDPRQLAATPDVDAVLLMDPERRIPDDELTAVISSAQDRPLLSMATRPGGVTAFVDEASPLPGTGPLPLPVPWFRGLRRGRRLLEAAEAFGAPVSASIEVSGPGPEGLLSTRLLDAFDLLTAWFGLPASVEACAVRASISTDVVPGRIFVIARFADGRAASVIAGADGGRHQRSVTLHGVSGRLRMVDDGTDWSDLEGRTVEFEPSSPPGENDLAIDLLESVEAIVRGLVPMRPVDATMDLLAVWEACMLSVRTGEPETIERVRRMLGRV
jgi:predicted dehydrogenase